MRRIGYLLCACQALCVCAGDKKQQDQQAEKKQQWEGTVSEQSSSTARGNWYIKRQYDRQARQVYKEIRNKLDEIEQVSQKYEETKKQLHDTVWQTYQQYGVDSPEITKQVRNIINRLEQEEDEESLSERERTWLKQARQHKASIQAVDDHLTSLIQLHQAVDTALLLFEDQVEQMNTYEQNAWNTYEKLMQTSSDHVAQEQYYKMVNIRDNADNILSYAKNSFASHINNLSSQINAYISRLTEALKTLQEAGVKLEERIEEEGDQEKGEEAQPRPEQEQKQQKRQEESGYLQIIWNWISYPFTRVGEFLASIWQNIQELFGVAGQ